MLAERQHAADQAFWESAQQQTCCWGSLVTSLLGAGLVPWLGADQVKDVAFALIGFCLVASAAEPDTRAQFDAMARVDDCIGQRQLPYALSLLLPKPLSSLLDAFFGPKHFTLAALAGLGR